MRYPQDKGEFILDTDTSNFAIDAVLSQIQDGRLRVIAYGSRSLNKAVKLLHYIDRTVSSLLFYCML